MQHSEVEDVAWIYNGKDEVPPTVRRVRIAENIMKIPYEAFARHAELEEVILSSSVRVIGKRAFSAFFGCSVLTKVDFPSTVQVVDDCAFSYCTSLSRLGLNEGLERIGQATFESCESLTEVDIPSTVKVIGFSAFWGCKLLVRLGLNEGLEQIGECAFVKCESLTTVDIPSTVKVIDEGTFWKCKHLARVALHEGLKRIETGVFEECDSLSHLRIPQSVSSIATDAFCGILRCDKESRFGQVLGIDQFWKHDMLQPIDAALSVDWSSRKREIDAVVRQYERKEILSLLELGLWKVRIDEATVDQMLFVDRESFRFNSGASVVIPRVFPFLYKKDV
eukprot:scaffold6609_cov84-Cylindrotheca_fusiformis.AAC.2